MIISPHFSYDEVIRSKTATDMGLDNSLPPELLPKIQLVATEVLEKVRAHFDKPVKITSWWRCAALNQMISNNPESQHTKGDAVDFVVPGISNFDVASYIRDNLKYDQLILEATWIHVSYISEGNRYQALRTGVGGVYLKGLA